MRRNLRRFLGNFLGFSINNMYRSSEYQRRYVATGAHMKNAVYRDMLLYGGELLGLYK